MSAPSVAGLRLALGRVVSECESCVEDAGLTAPEDLQSMQERGAFDAYAEAIVECAVAVDADAGRTMLTAILSQMPASWWKELVK